MDSLTEQQQKWVQEAADSSAVYQRNLWREAEEEALEKVKAAGVEVNRPDKNLLENSLNQSYEQLERKRSATL
ncbi:MAG: hypothetical protein U5K69_30180 [Balneolaceae bacterium]|nr:hypothetical protein [Balneolaceae bacterium]